MSRVLMSVCCIVVMVGMVGRVSADLIVYDGFDYAEGSLGGNQGGTGWDEGVAWDGDQTVTSPGLQHPGLPVVGNAVTTTSTASFRMMPTGFDAANRTLWISFICEDSATPDWSGISPFTGGSEALFIGKPSGSGTWGIALYNAQGDVASTGNKLSDVAVSQRVFFVTRIINGNSSARITLWLDPDVAKEPTVDTAFYDSETAGETLGRVLFDRIRIAGAAALFYDELRLGETYADVSAAAGLELASALSPEHEQQDVPRDTGLSWTAGEFAATHDVYFGTSFDDVNDASRADPRGVLVSQGQSALDYQPAGVLEFGQTYYWRIDEVNGAPDFAIYKGEVWSFTAEPLAYPIEGITASTNAISDPGAGPENTVNGSGLNELDQHSIDSADMWLGSPGGNDPITILYDFDRVYKMHEMLVWNYNVQFELVLGFGLKDVTVEYSENGADWTVLGDVVFAQGTAQPTYTANTTVDFQGVAAQHVRLTVNSGQGMMGQYGLSEVRFMYIPANAREPQPADGQTNVAVDTALTWRAGREAVTHDVYLSANPDALELVDSITEATYMPASIEFGNMYYWKIDEVNEADAISVWPGLLWNFTTQEFALIDGFEEYDDEDNAIFDTWLDGFVNDTGSTVGYFNTPFAETSIVNSGSQSMPLEYDNTAAPFYSEAEKDLGSIDLMANGADSLRLFVSGLAPAFNEAADGTILMNAIGADIWGTADQGRYAYKQLTGDGSMVARVDVFDGQPSTWAKAGVMIRQNDAVGSVHSFMCMTGGDGNGASWQARPDENADSVNNDATSAVAPPYWVRIDRSGDTLTGYLSPDGENWTQNGDPRSIAMTDPVLIGLAVTSHNAAQAISVEFSNVSFTGSVSGDWRVADIGVAQPTGNDVAPLYMALEDTSGNVAVVTHPDEKIVTRSGWNEWLIPLSDFAGANLSRAAVIYIGIGDRDNPTTGGTGMVFIDDVGYGAPLAP